MTTTAATVTAWSEHTVEVDGRRWAYRSAGTGEPVLVLDPADATGPLDVLAERMFERTAGSAPAAPGRDYGVNAALAAAIAAGEHKNTGPSNAPPVAAGPPRRRRPYFIGSPQTVAERIQEIAAQTGVGHFDLVMSDAATDFHTAQRSIDLFGREVIPALNGAVLARPLGLRFAAALPIGVTWTRPTASTKSGQPTTRWQPPRCACSPTTRTHGWSPSTTRACSSRCRRRCRSLRAST